MSPEPGPGRTCRVCGTGLEPDSFRCAHCGATYGERNRCPHCGAVADVEPHKTLRYRCRVCGGPRVPLADNTIEPSGVEWPLLEEAQRARMRVAAWRVAAGVVGAFGTLSLLVMLLTLAFITPGVLATTGLLAAVSMPLVLAAIAWSRARHHVRERDRAIDQAWVSAASDVVHRKDEELDARGLARTLRIDEAQAEQLLARLDVENVVRARVTDAGELVYTPAAGGKVRVSEPSPGAEPEEQEETAGAGEQPAPRRAKRE
jgi:predicted  nucleic acid-binding Zn-ribbon protein